MKSLIENLKQLETAEEFLDYFNIVYEQRVVDVYRLIILQGATGLIDEATRSASSEQALFERFRRRLQDAYSACRDGTFGKRAKAPPPAASACETDAADAGTVFIPLEAVMGLRRPRQD